MSGSVTLSSLTYIHVYSIQSPTVNQILTLQQKPLLKIFFETSKKNLTIWQASEIRGNDIIFRNDRYFSIETGKMISGVNGKRDYDMVAGNRNGIGNNIRSLVRNRPSCFYWSSLRRSPHHGAINHFSLCWKDQRLFLEWDPL